MTTKIPIVCAFCTKTFELDPWKVTDSTRYCSTECRGNATRKYNARELVNSVDEYMSANDVGLNAALKALGVNGHTYYNARKSLGLGTGGTKEGIRPGDAIATKRPAKKVWDAQNLRWKGTGT